MATELTTCERMTRVMNHLEPDRLPMHDYGRQVGSLCDA